MSKTYAVSDVYGGTCVACVRHAPRKAHLLVGVDDAHRRGPALRLPGDKGADVVSELHRMLLAGDDYACATEVGNSVGWTSSGFCRYVSISVHPAYGTAHVGVLVRQEVSKYRT